MDQLHRSWRLVSCCVLVVRERLQLTDNLLIVLPARRDIQCRMHKALGGSWQVVGALRHSHNRRGTPVVRVFNIKIAGHVIAMIPEAFGVWGSGNHGWSLTAPDLISATRPFTSVFGDPPGDKRFPLPAAGGFGFAHGAQKSEILFAHICRY
jgi:hypothetical protein